MALDFLFAPPRRLALALCLAACAPTVDSGSALDLAMCVGPDCQPCHIDTECKDHNLHCDPVRHVCTGCGKDTDCPKGKICSLQSHTCVAGCSAVQGCVELSGVCEVDSGTCVECVGDPDCTGEAKPQCDPASHHCVPCTLSHDTCMRLQYCDADSGSYVCKPGCKNDDECNPPADAGAPDGGAAGMRRCAMHNCVDCMKDDDCPMGQTCTNNKCVSGCTLQHPCSDGLTCCDTKCVDATKDAKNCGGCGKSCTGSALCCGGGCLEVLQSDVKNCGGCGRVCSGNHVATVTCTKGVCDGPCDIGYADCNNDKQKDGCETALADDVMNCGGCGLACSSNHIINSPACTAGKCTGTCDSGYENCSGNRQKDGCETNVLNSTSNCGGCGKKCSTNHMASVACVLEICAGTCATGYADCNSDKLSDGCETSIADDPKNCGVCGTVCSNLHVSKLGCTASVCSSTCEMGWENCSFDKTAGCATNVASDLNNCGGCGKICSNSNITMVGCHAGVCDGVCNQGYTDCKKDKQKYGCETNTAHDPSNCGKCGAVCSSYGMGSIECDSGLCDGICNGYYGDCNNDKLSDGCETILASDAANCGGCGKACSKNHMQTVSCGGFLCDGACAPGWGDCDNDKLKDGCETDLMSDVAHCGACKTACAGGKKCVSGACV